MEGLSLNAGQRGVSLSFHGEPCMIHGNKDMVRELTENLVQNAIVKHIVEIHDAKIEVDSAPGAGTTVSILF